MSDTESNDTSNIKRWPPEPVQPPQCVNHYVFMANWPPPEPPTCAFGQREDVFPPKNAPLQVWMQAYALRWGTWSMEIKDPQLRQHLLDVVTQKMSKVWELAVELGYGSQPVTQISTSCSKEKSNKKLELNTNRARSPYKTPAGFAFDGKDKLAITQGELDQFDLTMEVIQQRAASGDSDAGKRRHDEVLTVLGKDRLEISDWSRSRYPTVTGRNLLMYALYVIESARSDRKRLDRLMLRFTRQSQKKATQNRINIAQQREHQHMALVTELTLRELEEGSEEPHIDEQQ